MLPEEFKQNEVRLQELGWFFTGTYMKSKEQGYVFNHCDDVNRELRVPVGKLNTITADTKGN